MYFFSFKARTEAIATYALCSFSNPGSIAGIVATLAALCPEQRQNGTDLAFRAYVGGLVTCFITASIAGNESTLIFFKKSKIFSHYSKFLLIWSQQELYQFLLKSSFGLASVYQFSSSLSWASTSSLSPAFCLVP